MGPADYYWDAVAGKCMAIVSLATRYRSDFGPGGHPLNRCETPRTLDDVFVNTVIAPFLAACSSGAIAPGAGGEAWRFCASDQPVVSPISWQAVGWSWTCTVCEPDADDPTKIYLNKCVHVPSPPSGGWR